MNRQNEISPAYVNYILGKHKCPVLMYMLHINNAKMLVVITGILCGKCQHEDKGFSALLNKCVSCGYTNILLVVALSELYNYICSYSLCAYSIHT